MIQEKGGYSLDPREGGYRLDPREGGSTALIKEKGSHRFYPREGGLQLLSKRRGITAFIDIRLDVLLNAAEVWRENVSHVFLQYLPNIL